MLYYEFKIATRPNKQFPSIPPGFYSSNHSGIVGPFILSASAERIWREDDFGDVMYQKYRGEGGTEAPVDMDEFFWVKLKAKAL